ncbi:Clavaminate synthase-like protein [Daldinia decipiens]|uniref:Clavaminate synthase-like protein n=1 Tax=Daldinia decipiens TaxID=326647 RepID=UPI0020C2A51C|nr:Clavaminate synthase-like protein [Daldinia decipiens]KAI1653974.1 Clavaminate synthase-like protein [Daldinia decipiens]
MTNDTVPHTAENAVSLQPWMHREGHGLVADVLSRQQDGISHPPRGFPPSIHGPTKWSGLDPNKIQPHTLTLDGPDVAAIRGTLESSHELELDGDEVTRECFPLPSLQDRLEKCAFEVHRGCGLCIIRGLNPDNYTIEDNIVLFLAIASYIGDERGLQNAKGDMLWKAHVTESKTWTVPKEKRHGIHTNYSLPFHNDMGCEILSIQVRDRADEGGRTCVASIAAVYNDLVQTKPWVLHALAKHNWPIQTSSRREPPFVLCPLIEYHAGNLLTSMDPSRIGPHPLIRNGSIPNLTPEQQEALVVLEETAQKHQIQLDTQPGDLIFINNLALLHGRESYLDSNTSSRHLVRLWLRNTQLGWPIPPSMSMPWDAAFGERAKKVMDRYYPIMPMPEYIECKYSNGTAAFVADDDNFDDGSDSGSKYAGRYFS